MKIIEKEYCVGCTACANSCPEHCIIMKSDNEGFYYPQIDENKCRDCNYCKKVCPVLNEKKTKKENRAYAIINKDDEIRMESTSGGFFSIVAMYILKKQGIVVGAEYDKQFNVNHIVVEDIKNLYKLRGAKYTQSNLGSIFQIIKENLVNGRNVLFSGTSCQVAGLKNFLGKEYENLLCIDLVCHGVPSPKIWTEYIKYRAEQDNKGMYPELINLRSKKTGWSNYSYSVQFVYSNGKEYLKSSGEDPFMRAFISNLSIRPSCAECKFRGIDRDSDFTLGDFWGIWNQDKSMDDNKGTSLVYVHTKKAMQVLNDIKEEVSMKEMDIDKSWIENPSVMNSVELHYNKNLFYEEIDKKEKEFKVIVDEILGEIKNENNNYTKSKISCLVHRFLKRRR